MSARFKSFLTLLWYALTALVIFGSLVPGSSTPVRWLESLHLSDKLIHGCAYAVLAFLPVIHEKSQRAVLRVAIVLAAGIAIEFAQVTAGRNFDARDMVANGAGLTAGVLLGLPFRFVL